MWMIRSYGSEWASTPRGTRIAIGLWLLAILAFWGTWATRSLLHGRNDLGWAGVSFLYWILFKVLWPFMLGAAIRRRGGSFGAWFLMGVIFGSLITGVWYLLTLRKLPVLAEYSDSPTA